MLASAVRDEVRSAANKGRQILFRRQSTGRIHNQGQMMSMSQFSQLFQIWTLVNTQPDKTDCGGPVGNRTFDLIQRVRSVIVNQNQSGAR